MLPTKFRIIWPCGFRGEDFQKQTNHKQESPVVAMFVNGLGQNEQSLQRTFHRCFLPSFGSFGHVVSEEMIFRNRPIRNKNRLWRPCLLIELERNEYSLQRTARRCFLPSFGSFGQAVSEEKIFQKSTNQKQESPVVAMFVNGSGRNEQSLQRTFHRFFLPNFGSFNKAVTEEKNFFNQPIRTKSRLWRPCLLTDRDEMNNLYRGPSIDASYQVSVHLVEGFQRHIYP